MRGGILGDWTKMQEDLGNPEHCNSIPIFCSEHADKGRKLFKTKGESSLSSKPSKKTPKE